MNQARMRVVGSRIEIENNIRQLEEYRHSRDGDKVEYYKGLIKRGICFVIYNQEGKLVFSPSRFVGYANNTMNLHEANALRHGSKTNAAINHILGTRPSENDELEREYQRFCAELGIEPRQRGQFGHGRKYWRMG